jgi:hypothetical protein
VQTNPLVSFRETLGLSPEELAKETSVGVVIILLQEKGIPHHLHPNFLRKFPDIVELIPAYQAYRVGQRRRNFAPPKETPTDGPSFSHYLNVRHLDVEEFSELGCMPQQDIRYALHHWRLPITIQRFFEEISAEHNAIYDCLD